MQFYGNIKPKLAFSLYLILFLLTFLRTTDQALPLGFMLI